MKLSDILSGPNATTMLESLLEPDTRRPPSEKGADAIRVNGYVVRGHWRRRWHPPVEHPRVPRRRHRAVTPSMLEEDDNGGQNFNR